VQTAEKRRKITRFQLQDHGRTTMEIKEMGFPDANLTARHRNLFQFPRCFPRCKKFPDRPGCQSAQYDTNRSHDYKEKTPPLCQWYSLSIHDLSF